MKPLILISLFVLSSPVEAIALDIMRGSIVPDRYAVERFAEEKIGTTFTHEFVDCAGRYVIETYEIQSDHRPKIIARRFE